MSGALFVLLLPVFAFASGLIPYCKFSTAKDRTIFGGAKYRIAAAYDAADFVVTGQAAEDISNGRPQRLKVNQVIKGKTNVDFVSLVGRRCSGTACEGLALPRGLTALLLLREVPNGLYHKVDGNGNDACPNVFEIHGDEAYIGSKRVKLTSLRTFFKSQPDPIPFP